MNIIKLVQISTFIQQNTFFSGHIIDSLMRKRYFTQIYNSSYMIVFAIDNFSKFPVYSKYFPQCWMDWQKDPSQELTAIERYEFNEPDDPNYYITDAVAEQRKIIEEQKKTIEMQSEVIVELKETIATQREALEIQRKTIGKLLLTTMIKQSKNKTD